MFLRLIEAVLAVPPSWPFSSSRSPCPSCSDSSVPPSGVKRGRCHRTDLDSEIRMKKAIELEKRALRRSACQSSSANGGNVAELTEDQERFRS